MDPMTSRTDTTSHPDASDESGPTDHPRAFVIGMVAYVALVVIGVLALTQVHDPPLAHAVVVAVLPAGAMVYALAGQFRSMRSQEGIERVAYTDSSAIAFFVVVLSALSWFFLEVFADAPRPSALVTWVYGLGVWWILNVVLRRRYR
jgi:hypothetical protein